jgi:hypothetical protein
MIDTLLGWIFDGSVITNNSFTILKLGDSRTLLSSITSATWNEKVVPHDILVRILALWVVELSPLTLQQIINFKLSDFTSQLKSISFSPQELFILSRDKILFKHLVSIWQNVQVKDLKSFKNIVCTGNVEYITWACESLKGADLDKPRTSIFANYFECLSRGFISDEKFVIYDYIVNKNQENPASPLFKLEERFISRWIYYPHFSVDQIVDMIRHFKKVYPDEHFDLYDSVILACMRYSGSLLKTLENFNVAGRDGVVDFVLSRLSRVAELINLERRTQEDFDFSLMRGKLAASNTLTAKLISEMFTRPEIGYILHPSYYRYFFHASLFKNMTDQCLMKIASDLILTNLHVFQMAFVLTLVLARRHDVFIKVFEQYSILFSPLVPENITDDENDNTMIDIRKDDGYLSIVYLYAEVLHSFSTEILIYLLKHPIFHVSLANIRQLMNRLYSQDALKHHDWSLFDFALDSNRLDFIQVIFEHVKPTHDLSFQRLICTIDDRNKRNEKPLDPLFVLGALKLILSWSSHENARVRITKDEISRLLASQCDMDTPTWVELSTLLFSHIGQPGRSTAHDYKEYKV